MIFDRIYDDIPPQMKNLYMVIPILMYFLTFTHGKHLVPASIPSHRLVRVIFLAQFHLHILPSLFKKNRY